jgi:hypothetical protein
VRIYISGTLAAATVLLTGCGVIAPLTKPPTQTPVQAVAIAPPPPVTAKTVEDFDTTTAAQRQTAVAAPKAGARLLGQTVASLGDPTRPGFWAETPLVKAPTSGSLVYKAKGTSVEVELIPIDGGGSRVSLAALRLLDAPLTDLPLLDVYAR